VGDEAGFHSVTPSFSGGEKNPHGFNEVQKPCRIKNYKGDFNQPFLPGRIPK
jgi:hypothetical protein